MFKTHEIDNIINNELFEGADDPNAPSQKSNRNRDPKQFAEARVDIRKFAQFLSGQQVNPLKVICSKYNIEKKVCW